MCSVENCRLSFSLGYVGRPKDAAFIISLVVCERPSGSGSQFCLGFARGADTSAVGGVNSGEEGCGTDGSRLIPLCAGGLIGMRFGGELFFFLPFFKADGAEDGIEGALLSGG